MEAEYQPINSGIRVLSPVAVAEGRRGRVTGSPSLVRVLVKTYGLPFMASVFFKLISDVLAFANPLILK